MTKNIAAFKTFWLKIQILGILFKAAVAYAKSDGVRGGRGKRGGARVIYYWATKHDQIFMLYAYAKNERDDLTKDQLSVLRAVVVAEFKDEK